jgi:Tat protein translocase TatC
MREVRMTFGEHLEELRSRIIMALVWLAVTTTVCFYYGHIIMDWVQQPHLKAVKAGLNVHHYAVLDKSVVELEALIGQATVWDGVFPKLGDEVLRVLRAQEVRDAIGVGAAQLMDGFPGLTEDERHTQAEKFIELAAVLVDLQENQGAAVKLAPDQGFRTRANELVAQIEGVRARYQPTRLQSLFGLGRSFDHARQVIADFAQYLQQRHDELSAGYKVHKTPAELRQHLRGLVEDPEKSAARERTLTRVGAVMETLGESLDELLSEKAQMLRQKEYMEGFMNYFKVCLYFGIFLALPLILWEMWRFIGAGLYSREQKYVILFTPFSIALLSLGVMFGYFWMIPFVLEFLATWGAEFSEPDFAIGGYIDLLFTLTVILGLVFQTPLVMIFLNQIDVVSAAGFAGARKYTLLGAVVFSTMVTPPDPLSWSMMAGPIMLLYELGIRICRVLERGRVRREAAEASAGNNTSTDSASASKPNSKSDSNSKSNSEPES